MIRDLKPGTNVLQFFVLRRKEIKAKRDSEDFYLSVELGDASGRIYGSLWDDVQTHFEAVQRGDIVKVKAKVIGYRGRLHLRVEKIRTVREGDEFDIQTLVPLVPGHEALVGKLSSLVAQVRDTHLKQLLEAVFSDEAIHSRFILAPGGKLWHHNYRGGLLEHTLSVTQICLDIGKRYPGVDQELLLAAGLLHDIGKIDSYSYETLIDFTDQGRLLGHIVIGSQLVAEKIKSIAGFPQDLSERLQHLILSHQGKLEHASPVVPMTLEGLILYYADEMDSKANAFLRIARRGPREGTNWSNYVNMLDRYFYLGPEPDKPG